MDDSNIPSAPPRRRRLVWRLTAGLIVLLAVAALSVPALLSTPSATRRILARANRALAPARLEARAIRLSWFGPTRIEGLVLRDAEGDAVVSARHAVWDRSLGRILFDRPRYGTLRVDAATFDVERKPDGTVDLYQAIRPILGLDPRSDLRIVGRGIDLRLRAPELTRPIVAPRSAFDLHIPPRPTPVGWSVRLAGHQSPERLDLSGTIDRSDTPPDLAIRADGSWPIAARVSGREFVGRFAPAAKADRVAGRWTIAGKLRVSDAELPIAGRSLRIEGRDAFEFSGGLQIADGKLEVRPSVIDSPYGRANVASKGTGILAVDASLALPRLRRDLGKSLRLPDDLDIERGTLVLRTEIGGPKWKIDAGVRDLAGRLGARSLDVEETPLLHAALDPEKPDGTRPFEARMELKDTPWIEGPLSLAMAGAYAARPDALALDRLAVTTTDGTFAMSGRVATLTTNPSVHLTGSVKPEWDELNARLAERVEPGAHVLGGDATFRLVGPLALPGPGNTLPPGLTADVTIPVSKADVYGLILGPTTLAARVEEGGVSIDPIDTSLNEGTVHLEPTVVRGDDGTWAVRLGGGSTIKNARINDEVSRRVLSYLVPVMERATRAGGLVSVDLDSAEFPLREGASRRAVVEGHVVFTDVTFAPGPLAEEIFRGLNLPGAGPPTVRLDRPVLLSIRDGKVHQRGLSVPLGVAQTTLDGTVDFDGNLDLLAVVGLKSEAFQNPLPALVAGAAQLRIPIEGTLDRPKVDREAFRAGLQETGRDLLRRGALAGAAGALLELTKPRADAPGDAAPKPPKPTPAERKMRRLERREERRRRSGG